VHLLCAELLTKSLVNDTVARSDYMRFTNYIERRSFLFWVITRTKLFAIYYQQWCELGKDVLFESRVTEELRRTYVAMEENSNQYSWSLANFDFRDRVIYRINLKNLNFSFHFQVSETYISGQW